MTCFHTHVNVRNKHKNIRSEFRVIIRFIWFLLMINSKQKWVQTTIFFFMLCFIDFLFVHGKKPSSACCLCDSIFSSWLSDRFVIIITQSFLFYLSTSKNNIMSANTHCPFIESHWSPARIARRRGGKWNAMWMLYITSPNGAKRCISKRIFSC